MRRSRAGTPGAGGNQPGGRRRPGTRLSRGGIADPAHFLEEAQHFRAGRRTLFIGIAAPRAAAGLEAGQVREFTQLTEENARLKRLVAELSLDKAVLQDVLSKKFPGPRS